MASGAEVLHHVVHLIKFFDKGFNLSMEFLVLGILIIEHCLIVVPLFIGVNGAVFPVCMLRKGKEEEKNGMRCQRQELRDDVKLM